MFLKFLDDMEQRRELEAELEGVDFRPIIEAPYRWRDWTAEEKSLSGDDLITFINTEEIEPTIKRVNSIIRSWKVFTQQAKV